MTVDVLTDEQIRVIISEEMIEKGVEPPAPDSPQDQQLILAWRKGREKLGNL